MEMSAGLAYKGFLPKNEIFKPTMGYQFSFIRQNDFLYTDDTDGIGVTIAFYKFSNDNWNIEYPDSPENPWLHYFVFETMLTYRYDYLFSNRTSLFWGADVGFHFTHFEFDPQISWNGSVPTDIYTRAVLAPQIGLNFEMNDFFVIYYQFQYGLSYQLGKEEDWLIPNPKWNHMITNAIGVRYRFW